MSPNKSTFQALRLACTTALLMGLSLAAPLRAEAGLLDVIGEGVELIESDIKGGCASLLTSANGLWIKKDVLAAIKNGEAELVTEVRSGAARAVHQQVDGLVMGSTYNLSFLTKLLQAGDQLYAYDGRLIRYRAIGQKVAVIPELLEKQLEVAKVIEFSDTRKIRLSWPQKHLFPSRPDLAKLNEQTWGGFYSSWSKKGDDVIYEAQIKAKGALLPHVWNSSKWELKGYFNVKMIIKEDRIEIFFSERTGHPVDHIYAESRKAWLEELKQTELADFATIVNTGRPLVIEKGRHTDQLFEHFYRYNLNFMFFY